MMSRRQMHKMQKRLKFGALLCVCSLISQWILWFAYIKLEMQTYQFFALPLLLCILYHALQYDSGEGKLLSRGLVFRGTVLYPLILSVGFVLVMYHNFPMLEQFDGEGDARYAAQEIFANYGSKFVITSLYLLIFSALDAVYFLIRGRKKIEEQNNT